MKDFDYLSEKEIYLDSACQSLRPRPVLDSLNSYYETHNSCGERVKYPWGEKTDEKVSETRRLVLKHFKLSPRDYFVSFTLNTTYGINLILSSLREGWEKIYTTDIEHNSPFLSTISFSKKHNIEREVISRNPDGSVPLDVDFSRSVVVLNCASNFDGRRLENIKDLIKKVHKSGGIVIIDAAQAAAHSADILYHTEPDAICFSAHKIYAPSLGVMVVRKSFMKYIETTFIGGGMVDDVDRDSFILSSTNPDHLHTAFEPGLQSWGEIISLGAALKWLDSLKKSDKLQLKENYTRLFEFLSDNQKFHLVGSEPNPTMSFYIDGYDSHLIGAALGDEGIMARTGYFCAHYYLDHVRHFPPLIRFSLGYHNRPADIDKLIEKLSRLI